MLELSGISKGFTLPDGSDLRLLRQLDLKLSPGEVVAVSGRSGSGKTTLLNVIGLLDSLDAGTYCIDGRDVATIGDSEASMLRGHTFGFVFQQLNLLDRRTALQNVLAPLLHASWDEYQARRGFAAMLLDEVGLADRMQSSASVLSGGEQQRVAIARSMIRNPRWILADEPTGSLDLDTGLQVMSLLQRIVATHGCGLVLVTHEEGLARLADRHLVLECGALTER